MTSTSPLLVRVDRLSWYFFAGWFLLASLLLLVRPEWAHSLAFWGIILILINTLLRIVLLAVHFRAAHKQVMYLLCWLLCGILGASVVIQLLIRR
ncbi:MAG: hypothetical protein AB1644_06315 [Candidatus Zixiibacteriota bacterium]